MAITNPLGNLKKWVPREIFVIMNHGSSYDIYEIGYLVENQCFLFFCSRILRFVYNFLINDL